MKKILAALGVAGLVAVSGGAAHADYRTPSSCSSWYSNGRLVGSCSVTSEIRGHYVRMVDDCMWPEGDHTTGWFVASGVAISVSIPVCNTGHTGHYWQMS
jgi:hypothetical protein